MTDEELGQCIVRYGDRLALRAFCRQRTVTNEGEETVKSALMQRVRDRLGEQRKTPANRDTEGSSIVGNKHAVKTTRWVEMGWLHFDKGTYHQIKTRDGRRAKACFFQMDIQPKGQWKTSSLIFVMTVTMKYPLKSQ